MIFFFYTYVQVSELVAVVALLESSEESVRRTVVNARSCYSFTLYGKLVVVTSDHYIPDFFFQFTFRFQVCSFPASAEVAHQGRER